MASRTPGRHCLPLERTDVERSRLAAAEVWFQVMVGAGWAECVGRTSSSFGEDLKQVDEATILKVCLVWVS